MNDTIPKNFTTIALDAMGGDYGPEVIVPASIRAIENVKVAIALVGDPKILESELKKSNSQAKQLIKIVPSNGVIDEGPNPVLALRQNPQASVLVAAGIVKSGKADAFVSMGSTGAAIAAATVLFGTVDGIERGALGGPIVGYAPNSVIVDLGTNVDTKPSQLADFAALGSLMSRLIYKKSNPRVALLSVGSEEGKGNAQVKATTDLLKNSSLNFVGNVEPHNLTKNIAEVVVCDGFVGNMILKLTEGLGQAIVDHILSKIGDLDIGQTLAKEVFAKTNRLETLGGGPLLGLKKLAVVGHGAASEDAIVGAIETAVWVIKQKYIESQYDELIRIRAEIGQTEV